jgi:probable HAF family extracellular repeat protein
MAAYKGISALSNGVYQGTGDSCITSKGQYGWQYQCVEFIKRFYSLALGLNTAGWSGDAVDYFGTAAAKGLTRYENGGTVPPAPDDIIVFSGKTYGHVAIITSVSGNQIQLIEQNWSPTGVASLSLLVAGGRYTMADRGSSYKVLGWMRKPGLPPPPSPQYTITDLGAFNPRSINNTGKVVGFAWTAGISCSHAYLWSNGTLQDIGQYFLDPCVKAQDINDVDQIVGGSGDMTGTERCFLLSGGVVTKPLLPYPWYSQALRINNVGQIVGQGQTFDSGIHGFLYTSGTVVDLPPLPGGTFSTAYDINNAGQAVGVSTTSTGDEHAVLYDGAGIIKDLGTLPGLTQSKAYGINDSGRIVGNSFTPAEHGTAFVYTAGTMTPLPTLLTGESAQALGINNVGQIVGSSYFQGTSRAVLWNSGTVTDLSTLIPAGSGYELIGATAINDSGQIVCSGVYNGQYHAFLLTPIK